MERLTRLAAAGVVVLSLAVYVNALGGDFVWDDRPLILGDYMVKSFDHLHHLFTNDFFFRDENDLAYGYYRPVTTLSYVVDYALHADQPLGYHVTNALLHGLGTLLVLLLLRRLGFEPLAALVAGALFAVHPIHSESVAWIAGRTDLLAFALACAAFLFHLVGRGGRLPRGRRLLAQFASGLCFALALLAKEMAVVLIFWLALQHLILRRDSWAQTLRALLPALGVTLAYGIWRFAVIDVPAPGQPEVHGAGSALLSAAPTVARYLLWLVAPVDQSAYVQNPYVTSLLDWRLWAGSVVLAAVAVLVWKRARSSPLVLFVALAAVFSFAPIVNLVRVAAPDDMGAVMAERFAYFPSLWLLALVALGVTGLLGLLREQRLARVGIAVAVVAALAVLSAATVVRNRVWRDERALFTDALEHAPEAPLLWGNLANFHLRTGDPSAAETALARLESLAPDSYFALSSRALSHVMAGRLEQAVDLQERVVLSSRRRNQVAINNLAYLYRVTGRVEQARDLLEELIADGKGYSDVRFNLAEIERAGGNVDAARRQYELALEAQPDNRRIGTALAQMELQLGRNEAAERVFRELLRYHPESPGLLNNLALALRRQGRLEQATEVLERAVELDPDYARARQQLAEVRRAQQQRTPEP